MTKDADHPAGAIEDDHRVLRGQLEALADAADRIGILSVLQGLPKMLSQHFADEEAGGGLYDDLERRSPAVSKELEVLRGEHRSILKELEALTHEVESHPEGEGSVSERTRANVNRCMEKLRRHEHVESRMIADVYYTDEGGLG
jgi:hypothetical protein